MAERRPSNDAPPAKKAKREKVGVGVGVVVTKGRPRVANGTVSDFRILVGLRKGSHGAGQWALPGGWLEKGEEFLDCALRELREETGIAPSDSDLPTRGESKARAAGTLPFVANNTQMDGVHSVTVFCCRRPASSLIRHRRVSSLASRRWRSGPLVRPRRASPHRRRQAQGREDGGARRGAGQVRGVALVLARGARRAAALPSIKSAPRDGRGAPRAQRRRLPRVTPPYNCIVSESARLVLGRRSTTASARGRDRCRRSTTTTSPV